MFVSGSDGRASNALYPHTHRSAGASTRRPLGVAVVGGLAFSQLVTLYVTPVFYTYLDELQQRFSRRRRVREVAPAGAPESAPA